MISTAKRRRKTWITLGLAALPAGAALWYLTHLPMDSLLARATRVGIVTDRDDGFWMSGHEFVTVTSDADAWVRGILHDVATGKQRSVNLPVKASIAARGGSEYAIQSLAPDNRVEVTTWDKTKMDQALVRHGEVRLAGFRFGGLDYYPVTSGGQPHLSGAVATLQRSHFFTMHLPPGAPSAVSILFSARGDRWAVAVSGWRTTQVPLWLRGFFPHGSRKYGTEIYTGETSGGATHRLGSVRTAPAPTTGKSPPNSEWHLIRSLQWLPDGKRLSFVYDNVLYTIPVQGRQDSNLASWK